MPMVIQIDPPAWPAHGILWSHLVSDTSYAELHEFARRLGLPRRSFDLDHYDLPENRYDEALRLGARATPGSDLVRSLRASGLRVPQVDRPRVRPERRLEYLHAEWGALGAGLGLRPASGWDALGRSLVARWSETHRSYHDLGHLEDVLLAIDHLATLGERIAPETLLAAWFHDAVYRGEPGEDERASARLAVVSLEGHRLDDTTVSQVRDLILATAPQDSPEAAPLPLAHLLDADLSIFGAGERRYLRYASSVREEYAHLPDDVFRAGRAQILDRYLERPAIYRTRASRSLWEARARENLGREIAVLRSV